MVYRMSGTADDKCLDKAGQDPSAGNEQEIYKLSCKVRHIPDLNAIRDEIMADAEQLVYLLTFK